MLKMSACYLLIFDFSHEFINNPLQMLDVYCLRDNAMSHMFQLVIIHCLILENVNVMFVKYL